MSGLAMTRAGTPSRPTSCAVAATWSSSRRPAVNDSASAMSSAISAVRSLWRPVCSPFASPSAAKVLANVWKSAGERSAAAGSSGSESASSCGNVAWWRPSQNESLVISVRASCASSIERMLPACSARPLATLRRATSGFGSVEMSASIRSAAAMSRPATGISSPCWRFGYPSPSQRSWCAMIASCTSVSKPRVSATLAPCFGCDRIASSICSALNGAICSAASSTETPGAPPKIVSSAKFSSRQTAAVAGAAPASCRRAAK